MKTIDKMDLKDYFDKKLENSDVRQIGWRIRGEVLYFQAEVGIRDRIPMASIAEAAMREYLKVKGIKLLTDGETN